MGKLEVRKGGGKVRCKKCQSRDLVVVRSGPHFKLVCKECLTFQKFLSKTDAKTFDQLKQKKEEKDHDQWNSRTRRLF